MIISWSTHAIHVFFFVLLLLNSNHTIINIFQRLFNIFIYDIFFVLYIHAFIKHLVTLIIFEGTSIMFSDKTSIKGWCCAKNWWPLWGINATSYLNLFHHTAYLMTLLYTNNLILIGNWSNDDIVVDFRIILRRSNIVLPPTAFDTIHFLIFTIFFHIRCIISIISIIVGFRPNAIPLQTFWCMDILYESNSYQLSALKIYNSFLSIVVFYPAASYL